MIRAFLRSEAAPALALMACAAVGFVLANSPLAHGWHAAFNAPLSWSPIARLHNLHDWINDGLMAVFFFVVGLEIKREILIGELSEPKRRRLPVIAAVAGMAMPAAIFVAATQGRADLVRGWAIPAATDIAFAMGVLALLGPRVPRSIRMFLLTVAIVDDLGAVAVIALFFTESLDLGWLGAAVAVLAAMTAMNRFAIGRAAIYAALAGVLWFAVLHSGIHPTVAGVLAAFTIPLKLDRKGDSMLLRFEHALVPVVGFVIVPLFGLANASVSLGSSGWASLGQTLPLGIALGLFLGKQLGIGIAVLACDRFGIAPRPEGAGFGHIWGTALLCGIGFTMSLFIAGLAFPMQPDLAREAKLGVLAGSLLSALGGVIILCLSPRPAANKPE
jgi:Na+:H+ antiporter, NhaA family